MADQGKLGIGSLQSVQKTSDEEEETSSASRETFDEGSSPGDGVPAGTGDSTDESSGENSSGENSSVSEEPQATQEPQEDGPLGEEAGTMVYDQSPEASGYQKVKIKCQATDCIFNRQKNCHAQEVEIDMSKAKGQVPSATSCKTYQPATPNESTSEEN